MQPELYEARAKRWLGNLDYQAYTDYETVLIAPREYYARYKADCDKFDRFVPHEEISAFILAIRRHTAKSST
jgi:hypothetical protein